MTQILGPQFSREHVSWATGWDPGTIHEDVVPETAHAHLERIPVASLRHWSNPALLTDDRYEHEVPYTHEIGKALKENPETVPPIVTYKDTTGFHHVEDGNHRISAAEHYGVTHLNGYVFNHTPRDAYQHKSQ